VFANRLSKRLDEISSLVKGHSAERRAARIARVRNHSAEIEAVASSLGDNLAIDRAFDG
jgi:hypothetical protein